MSATIRITRGDLAVLLSDCLLFSGTDKTLAVLWGVQLTVEAGRNGMLGRATNRFIIGKRMVPAEVDVPHDDELCDDPECGVARTAGVMVPLPIVKAILATWKPDTAKARKHLGTHFEGTLTARIDGTDLFIAGHEGSDDRLPVREVAYPCNNDEKEFPRTDALFDRFTETPAPEQFSMDLPLMARFGSVSLAKEIANPTRLAFRQRGDCLRVRIDDSLESSTDWFEGLIMTRRMAGHP